jgi:hypothetical protein
LARFDGAGTGCQVMQAYLVGMGRQ